MEHTKYPRTPHFPFSPGGTNDDKIIDSTNESFGGQEVIITEKMDGENSTLYHDHYHARSLDSRHHPSRDWLKKFHGEMSYKIPENLRVCGENLYALHSVGYENLESYFYGFSVWDQRNVALSWDETLMWFEELGITPVPVIYRGMFDPKIVVDLAMNIDITKREGFVVRVADEIMMERFEDSFEYGPAQIAKWVRRGHVQTDTHWMHQSVVPNKLKT